MDFVKATANGARVDMGIRQMTPVKENDKVMKTKGKDLTEANKNRKNTSKNN